MGGGVGGGGGVCVLCAVCPRWELVFYEVACCPHSFCPLVPENVGKEEVAKPVVGNDSGTCKASFAGDVPRMFSLIKNEGDTTTLRYRGSFYQKPCRLEIEGRLHYDAFSTSCEIKVFWVLGGVWSQAET